MLTKHKLKNIHQIQSNDNNDLYEQYNMNNKLNDSFIHENMYVNKVDSSQNYVQYNNADYFSMLNNPPEIDFSLNGI